MCRFILPQLKLNIERWRWNEEYRVYVSNMGNFKDEHKKLIAVKIGSNDGYVKIKTPYGIKSAHRLVMLTWKPIPNAEDMTVDHLDHNKRNNKLDNLEWVTKEENWNRAMQDCVIQDNQTEVKDNKIYGFQAPQHKIIGAAAPIEQKTQTTKKQVIKGRRIRTGKQTFENIDEAIAWMRKSGFLNDSYIKENIESKIANAIKNNKLYCGRKWKYVNN